MRLHAHPAFEVGSIEAARYLEQQRIDFGRQFRDEVETGGELFYSRDDGDTWEKLPATLPRITCLRTWWPQAVGS